MGEVGGSSEHRCGAFPQIQPGPSGKSPVLPEGLGGSNEEPTSFRVRPTQTRVCSVLSDAGSWLLL